MRVLRGSPTTWEPPSPDGLAVAIGVFDGVHRGHRTVLADLAAEAQLHGSGRAAVTFDPHPLTVIDPDRALRLLGTVDQRIGWLAAEGVDVVAVLPFPEIRTLTPSEFADQVLRDGLGARAVVVGTDFRFGKDREGDVATLRSVGARAGFVVDAVPLLAEDHSPLSSSRIRDLVASGDVEAAADLLGRPYIMRGPVVRGDGRGKTIGVPTANIAYAPEVVVPKVGVYAGRVTVGGSPYPAVTNIGIRPTFDGDEVTVEAHLIDWEGDLYDCVIDVEITRRLRNEQKFASVDELVAQIHRDIAEART